MDRDDDDEHAAGRADTPGADEERIMMRESERESERDVMVEEKVAILRG